MLLHGTMVFLAVEPNLAESSNLLNVGDMPNTVILVGGNWPGRTSHALLSSGLSLKEIAQKLNRSPETIRTHGKSIYTKLGTNKVTQLPNLLSERA